MKTLIQGVKRRGIDILGLDWMSGQFCTLAVNYLFLMAYFTLESVFVNTLLLRVSGDMYAIFIYRGFSFAFIAFAMLLASAFSRWIGPVMSIRISGCAYAMVFIIMFFWMENISELMYFLGSLSGFAAGLYWSGHNVLLTSYTTQQNRSIGLGIAGIIEGSMTLMIPLISGLVIQIMPGMAGYRVMFGVALVTILAQSRYMKRLVPVERQHKPRDFLFAFKLVFRKLTLRMMLGAEYIRGVRDGAFQFFLNMVLFELVDNESLIGFNSFLTGALTILANWVYGRIAKPERRPWLSALAVTVLLGFGSILTISLRVGTIIFFNIINSFCAVFLINVLVNNAFDLFGESEMARSVMSELMGFRELAHALGRISGLIILSLFPKNLNSYIIAMLVLTASQYLAVLLMMATRRVQNRKKRQHPAEEEPA